ncbi:VanZ family protein [Streptomyces sp. 2314.4]|uniref:VanZ family protein n=1 Tax=Streptomyces sp. 2314.4 TaxID=1881025 RepID=UPI00210C7695|nr:VanZ family protein [Streptomyces sp. 2314.4]
MYTFIAATENIPRARLAMAAVASDDRETETRKDGIPVSLSLAFGAGVLGSVLIAVGATLADRPRRIAHRVVLALGWLWVACVIGFTFGTRSGGGQAVNLTLLDMANPADLIDFLLNMAMFAPGGILLAVLRTGVWPAGALAFLGSLAIEVTQYLTASGRTADINDLLSNTLGCTAGYACAAAVGKAAHEIGRRQRYAHEVDRLSRL